MVSETLVLQGDYPLLPKPFLSHKKSEYEKKYIIFNVCGVNVCRIKREVVCTGYGVKD